MAMGKIILRKLDLMGYTPDTQVWLVENGGGPEARRVAKELAADADAGHLLQIQHMGVFVYGVRGMEAARLYANHAVFLDASIEWA